MMKTETIKSDNGSPIASFELSMLAKHRGFNLPVNNYCNIVDKDRIITTGKFNYNYLGHGEVTLSRPTLDELQKWLRDEMDVHVSIQRHTNPDGIVRYCAIVNYRNEIQGTNGKLKSSSYEDVLEEGLKIGLSKAFHTNYSKIPQRKL